MGQKEQQLRSDVNREVDDISNKVQDEGQNLRQRVKEYGHMAQDRLMGEAEQLKRGQVQNAPIISTTTIVFICLCLLIPLGLYLRSQPEETTFDKIYNKYDDLWEGTKDTVRPKVKATIDYLNHVDTDHYKKQAKGKAAEAQKHMKHWRKDLNDFYNKMPSSSSVGDHAQEWKSKLEKMKDDGFEYVIDHYRTLTGQHPKPTGFRYYLSQMKHYANVLLVVGLVGIALLFFSHLLTNYYFIKNPPMQQGNFDRQREVRVRRET